VTPFDVASVEPGPDVESPPSVPVAEADALLSVPVGPTLSLSLAVPVTLVPVGWSGPLSLSDSLSLALATESDIPAEAEPPPAPPQASNMAAPKPAQAITRSGRARQA